MTVPLLEIKNLSIKFNSKQILNNVSLNVSEGEYLSVIGPNGAGKSTLLKCIIKIVESNQSAIKVNGKFLQEYKQPELAKQIAYLPQAEHEANFPFTVKEFIEMGRYPHIGPFRPFTKKDADAVKKAMEVTNVEPFENRLVGSLSGGERQKVLLAGALAQDAKLLLLDEATTYLDPKHMSEIKETLHRVNSELGTALISVTHDINMAINSCNRIFALKNGDPVFDGTVDELISNGHLKEIYEKDFDLIDNPKNGKPFVLPHWK